MTIRELRRLEEFFDFAAERHAVYIKKEVLGLPKPWTNDPVLGSYFFCNVFRTLDKTTVWIKKYVIDAYANDPDLWKRIIVTRFFSRVDCLEDIRINEGLATLDSIREGIKRRVRGGLPVHTQGFLVGPGFPGKKIQKWDQPFHLVNEIESAIPDYQRHVRMGNSLEKAHKELLPFDSVGPFLAYEYVTDYSYASALLAEADDIYDWSNPGPGAKRGMRRILGNGPKDANIPVSAYPEFSNEVLTIWQSVPMMTRVRDYLPTLSWFDKRVVEAIWMFINLTMREVEHWLCEFDKYKRGGSSKRRYQGGQE